MVIFVFLRLQIQSLQPQSGILLDYNLVHLVVFLQYGKIS